MNRNVYTLNDVVSDDGGIKTGPFGTLLSADEYSPVGMPVISVGEVGYGEFRLRDDTPRVSRVVTDRLPEFLLRQGDIVFGRKGAVDRSAWVSKAEQGWFLGSDGIRVRVRRGVDSRFISFQLRSKRIRDWLLQHAGGSTLLSLNQKTLSRVPIHLPPLPEQQAIAEVLGALDDKIAANTKLAATVDGYLSSLFAEGMSSGYEETELSEIADVNTESVKPEAGGVLRYIDIASVGVGEFAYPELSDWESAPGRARRKVHRGDTLWSTVRPNRRSHGLNLSNDPALVASTGLAVLSPRSVGFAYLYEATRRPEFTAYLENVAEGSAYPAVRADRFLSAPIPLVSADGVSRFEVLAAPLRQYVHALGNENRTLAATRDALLPQLMSGKLRVRDAEAVASGVGV